MSYQAKVYAQIFSRSRSVNDGSIDFIVDYLIVTGTKRSGKLNVTVTDLSSEKNIENALKDSVLIQLNEKYAPELFQLKDILGCSV